MTLGALETDLPHEMSCLSETNATIRRESGARVALSCVHTFQPRGACRPHVSPVRAPLAPCATVPACRERHTARESYRVKCLASDVRDLTTVPRRERGKQRGNQQIHDSGAAFTI